MDHTEQLELKITVDASVIRGAGAEEKAKAEGVFEAVCVGPDGKEKWRDKIENTVMTEGKNVALDAFLAGVAYTVTGPFMGLISSASFVSIAVNDSAAQINGTNGWKEAGLANAPTYTAPRKTAVWNAAAAGAKALSAALSFAITSTGTVKGAFMIFGTGAVNTIDTTTGRLWSAGLFTGGDKPVSNGDTLNISYSVSL